MRLTAFPLEALARWAATAVVTRAVPDDAPAELHVSPHRWEIRVEGVDPFVMDPEGGPRVPPEPPRDVQDLGDQTVSLMYLRFVLSAIAHGIPFRGVSDPQEIARRTIDRDWPPA